MACAVVFLALKLCVNLIIKLMRSCCLCVWLQLYEMIIVRHGLMLVGYRYVDITLSHSQGSGNAPALQAACCMHEQPIKKGHAAPLLAAMPG
jgi:hypothetical protein